MSEHSAMFLGTAGARYGFYAVARDQVGNLEAAPAAGHYDVQVSAGAYCTMLPLVRRSGL